MLLTCEIRIFRTLPHLLNNENLKPDIDTKKILDMYKSKAMERYFFIFHDTNNFSYKLHTLKFIFNPFKLYVLFLLNQLIGKEKKINQLIEYYYNYLKKLEKKKVKPSKKDIKNIEKYLESIYFEYLEIKYPVAKIAKYIF
ncbi:hypothetical protein [Clostridium perfringens]|uniref:hypothetical protein n=1 Tax=Clostridium perfringens TaxID=1502 RepID=UPI003749FB93